MSEPRRVRGVPPPTGCRRAVSESWASVGSFPCGPIAASLRSLRGGGCCLSDSSLRGGLWLFLRLATPCSDCRLDSLSSAISASARRSTDFAAQSTESPDSVMQRQLLRRLLTLNTGELPTESKRKTAKRGGDH